MMAHLRLHMQPRGVLHRPTQPNIALKLSAPTATSAPPRLNATGSAKGLGDGPSVVFMGGADPIRDAVRSRPR